MTSQGKRRVVVTGMGAITPVGNTIDTMWQNLLSGKTGIGPNVLIAPEDETNKIAGTCREFVPEDYMDKKVTKRMDRFTQLGMAAGKLAYEDSGLKEGDFDPDRFGMVVSSAAGGLHTIETQMRNALNRGFPKTSPFLVPMMIADITSGWLAIEYNAKGPNYCAVTACATGATSIGQAMRMIQWDEADVCFAGGSESPLNALSVAGFQSMRALSTRYDEPEKASRPFDKDRDGFVIAEGGGIVILEELEHAKKRGAKIYGEVIGFGQSADANDIVAPCADGEGAARAMAMALRDAKIDPSTIQYVNAHGTSTPLGDIAETIAIKKIFGDYAKNGLSVSSTKSMTGHMLGATGAVEAIACILAIRDKKIPPTINLDNADEQCDLDYTANVAKDRGDLTAAMSNSFGFGGHNASLIFTEYKP